MARAYTREFLVDVYLSPFLRSMIFSTEILCELEENAYKLYDRVGKEEFRKYASVTPEAIKEYQKS